ncbi:MAG: molybdenum cofactor biosynthesis protein MoaE [Gemmatimonadales bacterium]
MHLTERPIDIALLISLVEAPGRGGIASFLGTVRDHHAGRQVERLEYTAYRPMAEAECARIVAEAEARWPARIALEHRIGALGVGDIAVAIVAASAHRDGAFDACRYVIEELKHRVPIWKREYYTDGSVAWVDPTVPGGVVELEPGTP